MNLRPGRLFLWTALVLISAVGSDLFGQAGVGKPLHTLWSIQGKSNTVYFLGSIHLMKANAYPLPQAVEDAFARCSVVAFETDIAAASDLKTQMSLLAKGACDPGKTLKDYISKETYDLIRRHADESGVPMMILDGFKPWMAALTLATFDLVKGGFDPELGIDRHFNALAVKSGKKIVALESMEKQISLFTTMAEKDQEAMIKETVEDSKKWKTMIDDIVAAWRIGDVAALKKLVAESIEKYPDLHKKLLIDRNTSWLEKIEELFKGGKDAMVIVGSAHLVGKDSVLDLLRKRGFTAKQL
ncbi:MAG: TraB/GumN family protein [Opitutaceae bacterium]|nr:TraB/GumN family protein [Verrucomicrobiales bacterium]